MTTIQTRPLQQAERQAILSRFVEVPNPATTPVFCVDGRKGARTNAQGAPIEGPYLQALGGSYHMVALEWLLAGGTSDYMTSADSTFDKMKEKGMKVSVHRGHHGHGSVSDCGFADNFVKIVQTLQKNQNDIWGLITQAEGSLSEMAPQWATLMDSIKDAHLGTVPPGDALITTATEKYSADLQNLEGEHGEIAAVVNLKPKTTLDVDKNQDTQAFNLDLWHVLDEAEQLGMDRQKATLLSLGLYVATEMVLVENKGKMRLPIVVNK